MKAISVLVLLALVAGQATANDGNKAAAPAPAAAPEAVTPSEAAPTKAKAKADDAKDKPPMKSVDDVWRVKRSKETSDVMRRLNW